MSASGKILSGNETFLMIPAYEDSGEVYLIGDALVALSAPTSAVLNKWIAVTDTSSLTAGGNVSCAVKDDLKLEQTASETDKDRTICSTGQSATPTLYNFDAQANGLQDSSPTAQGVFNLFRDLTRTADVPFVLAQRIGKRNTETTAAGEVWHFYYAWTDNPIPGVADGGNLTIGETFIPKSILHLNYALAA